MVSRYLRRSGIAMGLVADAMGWVPNTVYQVGVGIFHEEANVFREAWPKSKIIGYEPNTETIDNIKDRYPGELVPVAVSDFVGRAQLNVKPKHADGASIYEFNEGIESKAQTIQVATMDHLVPTGPPDIHTLFWLDCEGCELQVLRGAENFIKKVEVINVEMTAKPYSKEWSSHNDVHHHLKDLGFRRQWVHTQRISSGQVDVIYVRPYLFMPQYCCCPCELEGECDG